MHDFNLTSWTFDLHFHTVLVVVEWLAFAWLCLFPVNLSSSEQQKVSTLSSHPHSGCCSTWKKKSMRMTVINDDLLLIKLFNRHAQFWKCWEKNSSFEYFHLSPNYTIMQLWQRYTFLQQKKGLLIVKCCMVCWSQKYNFMFSLGLARVL